MASALQILPDRQLEPLVQSYARAVRAERLKFALGCLIVLALLLGSGWFTHFDPVLFASNAHRFPSYFVRIFHFDNGAPAWSNVAEWFWGVLPEYNCRWLWALWDTLLIAYLGTLLGTLGGFVLSFMASANIARSAAGVFAARRALEFFRSVPEVVFALIFVAAFGIGPFAGVLAIAIHSTGALGKLFSDAIENIDMKPVDGLVASGGTWWETNRYAVLPQVLANFTSYTLWRFEINVRGASVMGLVGGGGIGQDLIEYIRKFYYTDVSALLILIVALVVVIDVLTGRLRHYLIGLQEAR
ncbi:MAG: phosphonate ABC transporter, permease protein PhnE [Hyphomicrobiaceae bacterium]|nr:phosphonate ABC transporter, permease protein PhnE [Hyphomicrobiaceae bacterium]